MDIKAAFKALVSIFVGALWSALPLLIEFTDDLIDNVAFEVKEFILERVRRTEKKIDDSLALKFARLLGAISDGLYAGLDPKLAGSGIGETSPPQGGEQS